MRAVVVGIDYFARYLGKLVNAHGKRWTCDVFPNTRLGMMRALWRLRGADALISFGGPGPNMALALAAHERRVPIVVIWAGTDLLVAARNPFDLEVAKREISADMAGAPWLAEELRAIGVPATYQPIIGVDAEPECTPLPERFTVLTYLPVPRRTFYGEDRIYAIARAMKDVRFVVVGAGERNPSAPANVEFCGWVDDMKPVIDEASVLLRLPEHDGPAMMVLEALARGRHVIWTYDFPAVQRAESMEAALQALQLLHERHRAGALLPNEAGRAFVAERFAREKIAAGLEDSLDRIVPERAGRARTARGKRLVVTGLGLFCAEVSRRIEAMYPEWEVQMLRPSSRLQVLASLAHLKRADVWYSIGSPAASRWMHYWARLLRIPRVMHWVGTDIENVRTDPALRRLVRSSHARHLTEIEWTASELSALGIPSEIAPLPLRHLSGGVTPLPERFTILLYVPKSRPGFYGAREYERLLAEFAHESPRVFIVGGGNVHIPEGVEATNFGWRSDLRDLYAQSTVLIRFTPHDGLSLMVVEALSFGRYVLWSKPFPYATHVSSYDEIAMTLRDLVARHKKGRLHAQYVAAEAIGERYATERCVDGILDVLNRASEGAPQPAVVA